jgi:peptidoglycan hydrolase-like protein with peptidoglycan-binding domain
MSEISAAVGLGGRNTPADVVLVQSLLTAKGLLSARPTGACDAQTIEAIKAFQHGFMHKPDGRIDRGGSTWRKLSAGSASAGAVDTNSATFRRLIPVPGRDTLNKGVSAVNNTLMMKLFGAPRVAGDYDQAGKGLTNPKLARNVTTMNVGPFKATGLTPAVVSLERVMADIQRLQPGVYSLLSSAGMLVVRFVRGSTTSISNHSWGTAIDLKIGGQLDTRGDNQVQYGLTLLAPIFNSHGWYWGAAFRTEDAMHFEAGRVLAEEWAAKLA